jgi:Tfp pilus assembly PilM family ATPase
MGNRLLGLDVSPTGVKAVQVKTDLNGRFGIAAFTEYDVQSPEGLSEAVRMIREDEGMDSDLCVTSLPAGVFSFRNLRMPFREKRKIRQTLNYELEPLIPHAIEDVLTDFVVFENSEGGAGKPREKSDGPETFSDLFVAAVPKHAVRQRLKALEPMQVPLVEIEAVPTALALISAGYSRKDPFVLLDVGASETVAVFVRGGGIFHVRSFAFGGAAITEAISRALKTDLDKAEQQKISGPPAAAESEIFCVCERFFAELGHTMQFLNLRRADKTPSRLVVTGGGALCKGFIDGLARYFSLKVEKLDLRTLRHVSMPAEAVDSWDPMRMNNALALAMRGSRKENGFNFRKSEFTGGGYAGMFKENIGRIAAVVLIVFGILAFDSAAGYVIDQYRLDTLKMEISGILKKNCPEITRVVDPVQQFKSKVTEAKQFASTGVGGENGILDLLKKISEAVPPSMNWLITDLDFDGEKIQLRGEADNFDSVEAVKREIAGSGPFRNVTVGGANLLKEKNKIEFELRMTCAR